MAVDVGSATGYLDLDISGFLANLRTAQNEADRASKNMATKVGNNITGIGKSMTSVGSTLKKYVTVPLLGIGIAGLKVASDFDSAMSGVQAISGATGEEFDALRAKAIELGGSTAFSANEVAEAMTEMAKAGWDSQQILDGMSGVLDATAASGEDLGTVSTIVADAITGFGMEAKESARVADLLTQAANSGTIGINDLGESFKYIAPVASSMGLSIEDVTTALSAMSMSGIKGSQAGTSLRGMLTRMVKPTDQVAAAMDELGIVLTNSDGTFKSLDQILSEMRGSFSGLTDEQKTYYAATLAGQEGMSGLLSLLNMSQEEYDEIAASMDNAGGVAEETAAIMQDNLQSKVEQLGGALESLAIKLADHVIPYLQKFVVWLTSLVDKFAALDPETQKTILKFAGIAAVIGPVILILGKLVTGIGSIISAFGKIPGAIKAVTGGFTKLTTAGKNVFEGFKLAKAGFTAFGAQASPLGAALAGVTAPMIAIVAVIATLVAAFKHLWDTNEEFRNNIIGIWNEIKDTLSGFFDGIVERLNALGFDFENIMDVLKAVWDAFCSLLAPVFEGVFQNISNILKTVTGVLTGILDVFIGLFTGNWDQFLQGIKGIFESIWNGIVSWIQNIWNTIIGLLDAFLNLFGTNIENVMTSISNFFKSIWNGIKSFFGNLWENLKSIVSTAIKAIQNTITNILNAIVTFWQNIWNGIKTFASTVWNSIKSVITSTFNAIKGTIENILNGISTTWSNIWNGIKSAVSTIWNGIKSVVSGAINSVKSTVQSILGTIQNVWSNGWNTVKNTLNNAWEGIKTGVSNGINNVLSFIRELPGKIVSALGNTGSLLVNAGKSIINGFLDGLKSAWDNVTGWIGDIGDWIAEHKGPEDYDKKLLVPAGNWIMEGLGKGLGEGFEGVKDQVSGMGNDIVNSFDVSEIPVGFELETTKLPEAGVKTFKDTIKSIYNDVALWFESIEARINGSIQRMTESLADLISQGRLIVNSDGTLGYIGYNGFTRIPTSNDDNRYGGNDRNDRGGGDTFIFNSPKAIDEIEAAKQMKQTKRDIAEGF